MSPFSVGTWPRGLRCQAQVLCVAFGVGQYGWPVSGMAYLGLGSYCISMERPVPWCLHTTLAAVAFCLCCCEVRWVDKAFLLVCGSGPGYVLWVWICTRKAVVDKRTALSVRTVGTHGMQAGMVSLEDTVVYSCYLSEDCTDLFVYALFVYALGKRLTGSVSSPYCG